MLTRRLETQEHYFIFTKNSGFLEYKDVHLRGTNIPPPANILFQELRLVCSEFLIHDYSCDDTTCSWKIIVFAIVIFFKNYIPTKWSGFEKQD